MNYRIIYTDELYHHGVKGMRWGVRRKLKLADKARAQANYRRRIGESLAKRRHDFDDDSMLNTVSKTEKRRSSQRARRQSNIDLKAADFWDKAAKDIEASSSYREGKKKFQQYKSISISNYGYVYV